MACVLAAVALVEAAVIGGVTWWLGSGDATTNITAVNNTQEATFMDRVAHDLSIKKIASFPENLPAVGHQITPFTLPATPIAPGVTIIAGWKSTPTSPTTAMLGEVDQPALSTGGLLILCLILLTIGLWYGGTAYNHFRSYELPSLSWLLFWRDASKEALIQEIKDLKNSHATLVQNGTEKDEEIKRLQSAAEKASKSSKAQIEKLEGDKQAAEKKADNFEKGASNSKQKLDKVEKELTKTKKMLADELAKTTATVKPEMSIKKAKKQRKGEDDPVKDAKEARAEAQKAREEHEAAEEKIGTLEEQVRDLKTRKNQAMSELTGAKTTIEELQSKQGKLKESIEKLKEDVQGERDVAAELRSQLEVMSGWICSLGSTIAQLEATRDELETKVSKEEGQKNDFQEQFKELEKSVVGKDEEISKLQEEKEGSTNTIRDMEKNLEQKAKAVSDKLIGSFYQKMEVKSADLTKYTARLEKEVEHLRLQLRKACHCRQLAVSNGSDDVGDDDDKENGPREEPESDDDSGKAAGDAAGDLKSIDEDGGMSRNDDTDADRAAKDSISRDTSEPRREDEMSPNADVAAEDLESHDDEDDDDPSGEDLFRPGEPRVLLPSCSLHPGCGMIWIEDPDHGSWTEAKKRRYRKKFRDQRIKSRCAYAAYAKMHPDAPTPRPELCHKEWTQAKTSQVVPADNKV